MAVYTKNLTCPNQVPAPSPFVTISRPYQKKHSANLTNQSNRLQIGCLLPTAAERFIELNQVLIFIVIREGATENTAVVSSLLSELVERGVDFSVPRLYILDGGKALASAVRKHAGEAGFIQRCQVHKRRNVVDHLPNEYKADVRRKLQNAYSMNGTPRPSELSINCIGS